MLLTAPTLLQVFNGESTWTRIFGGDQCTATDSGMLRCNRDGELAYTIDMPRISYEGPYSEGWTIINSNYSELELELRGRRNLVLQPVAVAHAIVRVQEFEQPISLDDPVNFYITEYESQGAQLQNRNITAIQSQQQAIQLNWMFEGGTHMTQLVAGDGRTLYTVELRTASSHHNRKLTDNFVQSLLIKGVTA